MGSEVDCSGVSRAVWLVKVKQLYFQYFRAFKLFQAVAQMVSNVTCSTICLAYELSISLVILLSDIFPQVPKYLSNIWMENTDPSGIVGSLQITK